jgi:hypothetical protein
MAGAGIEQRGSPLGLRMPSHGLHFTRNSRYVYSTGEGSSAAKVADRAGQGTDPKEE